MAEESVGDFLKTTPHRFIESTSDIKRKVSNYLTRNQNTDRGMRLILKISKLQELKDVSSPVYELKKEELMLRILAESGVSIIP